MNVQIFIILLISKQFSRSSAFGMQASVGRLSAIIGNVVFGELVDVNCTIPLLLVSGLLCLGGLSSLKLPKTDDTILT